MEKLGIDPKFLLTQVINFFLLFFLLSKLLYKPIIKLLDERKKKIVDSLDNAAKLKIELEKIKEDRRKMLDEVRKEGEIIIQKQKSLADTKREEMLEKARFETQRVINEGMEIIKREEELMLKHVEKRAGEIAVSMTKKVLGEMDKEMEHQVLGGMIKKLSRKN